MRCIGAAWPRDAMADSPHLIPPLHLCLADVARSQDRPLPLAVRGINDDTGAAVGASRATLQEKATASAIDRPASPVMSLVVVGMVAGLRRPGVRVIITVLALRLCEGCAGGKADGDDVCKDRSPSAQRTGGRINNGGVQGGRGGEPAHDAREGCQRACRRASGLHVAAKLGS